MVKQTNKQTGSQLGQNNIVLHSECKGHAQVWFTCGPSPSNLMLKWINKWIKEFAWHVWRWCHQYRIECFKRNSAVLLRVSSCFLGADLLTTCEALLLPVFPMVSHYSLFKAQMKEQKDSQVPECWIFQDSRLLFKTILLSITKPWNSYF